MNRAQRRIYLKDIVKELNMQWPQNRTINIVYHGHSVPSGYFLTPVVDTFNSYPYLLHKRLKERFPFTVINTIVTAIGGENSEVGEKRFEEEVLCHRPDILTIDYSLNDRGIGLEKADYSWRSMIEKALKRNIKVILLTPTADYSGVENESSKEWVDLKQPAEQVKQLADRYEIGLVDSFKLFEAYIKAGGDLTDLLSQWNHPNKKGHELVAKELYRWFPIA
jgi:acyl-CoA thioesterase I